MNLEDITLSEIRQKQMDKNCMIPLICCVPTGVKFIESRKVGGKGWGREDGELVYKVSVRGQEEVLEMVMVAQKWECN